MEVLDIDLIYQIAVQGAVYPRDYLMRVLQSKEMNYATATYYLHYKKQQATAKVAGILAGGSDVQL